MYACMYVPIYTYVEREIIHTYTPLNKMGICLEAVGKAWNSSLLAKGAADWLAAGAHLKNFPLKKGPERRLPSAVPALAGGCQRWRRAPKIRNKKHWTFFVTCWTHHYLKCFDAFGTPLGVAWTDPWRPTLANRTHYFQAWVAKGAKMCPKWSQWYPNGAKKCSKWSQRCPNAVKRWARLS